MIGKKAIPTIFSFAFLYLHEHKFSTLIKTKSKNFQGLLTKCFVVWQRLTEFCFNHICSQIQLHHHYIIVILIVGTDFFAFSQPSLREESYRLLMSPKSKKVENHCCKLFIRLF